MGELISDITTDLQNSLNPTVFSIDSVQGLIIFVLVLFIAYNLMRNAADVAMKLVKVIILIQLFYWLSLTGLNDIIPLSRIFKYDVFTAVAQLFVGTWFADVLLKIDAVFVAFFLRLWDVIVRTFPFITNIL